MVNGLLRNARIRGDSRIPLVVFGVLALSLLMLSRADVNLFDQARARISDATAPLLTAVEAPFQGLNRWLGNIGSIFTVYDENLRLKEENARLRQWQGVAMQLQSRVANYERLLHAVPNREAGSVLAHVIGRGGRPFLDTMILNAGKAHGVQPGEAVLDARGLVGRILVAGESTSWVIPLKDINSRIPVTIGAQNAQAIVVGNNSEFPGLETLSQRANIKSGDLIVTSGDGGLLPPGLPVGTVLIKNGRYRVALYADARSGSDVEVIDFKGFPEQPTAPSPADLPPPPPLVEPVMQETIPPQQDSSE